VHFTFLEVKENDLLNKVYEFRCTIMCDELKIVDRADYPDSREIDKYDPYSEHFAVLNANGEVCACIRLIHHSPLGYPTENNMTFDIDKNIFDRDKLGEFSRIFIGSEYRSLKTTKRLMEGIKRVGYLKLKEMGIEYSYGALEKSFLRLLNMYKMGYEPIGKEQKYGGQRLPCILYSKKLEEDNPELANLWREKYAYAQSQQTT
jgi:N-acyl-L-homoserine lactone synthetase